VGSSGVVLWYLYLCWLLGVYLDSMSLNGRDATVPSFKFI